MSYEIVVTYTKTADSPADAFKTMPVLKPDADFTQEQIDAFPAAYPATWDVRAIQDQLIIHYTFPSKEEAIARREDPIAKSNTEKQRIWQEANHLTRTGREL